MKILHINDMAGVAPVLVKYLRKAGHQADLISFIDDHEFGFCKFYKGRHFQDQDVMSHVLEGLIPQYDIIHLHFSYPLLPWLYKFNKPVVFHAHGTEIATETMEVRIAAQKAEGILVAGEQLLQYHPRAKYLPTIVDTDHFYPTTFPLKQGYLIFDIPYLDTERAIKEAQLKEGTPISVIDRASNTISYNDLPAFLNQFSGYIDYRFHRARGLLTDMSKTGLEALACGLKVYINGEWKTELPLRHRPENVVQQLIEYYEGLLEPLKTSAAIKRMDWMF